jgi:hypothetical protein
VACQCAALGPLDPHEIDLRRLIRCGWSTCSADGLVAEALATFLISFAALVLTLAGWRPASPAHATASKRLLKNLLWPRLTTSCYPVIPCSWAFCTAKVTLIRSSDGFFSELLERSHQLREGLSQIAFSA